jgi:tRNA threonylcarbamoyladenosine modification (KEOPS) complex Cgi121 subunit/molybdopterin converting factor small subunit
MITIRLLGGAKKAVGKPTVNIEKASVSVFEILKFLQDISADPRPLQPNNLIIAVNGVDSAALLNENTIAKSGDTVTIVTVVHGGTDMDGNYMSIIGVRNISEDPGKLVDKLRMQNKGVSIQAANARAVYGLNHLLALITITLEAEKRRIMLANKRETEFLLRLACTDQISEAIKRAGLKEDEPGCFIALSQNDDALQQFASYVRDNFEADDLVIRPTKEKKMKLSNILGITAGRFDEKEFLQYLVERAAILVK